VTPLAMVLAQQANIVLYPVLVRLTGGELCPGGDLHGAQDLAAATGGRAFFDSLDLASALRDCGGRRIHHLRSWILPG
jgi:hypothetical protein